MLLGADGVDYDLAGVVGAWRSGHKILRATIVQAGDRITWKSPTINMVLAAFLNSEFPSLIQNHGGGVRSRKMSVTIPVMGVCIHINGLCGG